MLPRCPWMQDTGGGAKVVGLAKAVGAPLLDSRGPMATIPQARLRNFSIIAHVDHGKSTLADRILELTHTIDARQMTSQVLDSMDLEREKGITIKARAVRLEYTARDGLTYGLNLIDTPGHVDFSYEVSRSLQACEGAILVVDAAQGIEAQTLANVHLALAQGLVIVPVINKIDLPSAQPEVVIEELENVLAIPREEVILVSAKDGTNIDLVLEAIVARVPAPKGDPGAPLQGLIFDSHYDAYKGVVAYVRLAAGHAPRPRWQSASWPPGVRRSCSSWASSGRSWCPCARLGPGEVGYVATGPEVGARLPGRATRMTARDRAGARAAAGLQAGQGPRVRGHLPARRAPTTRCSATPWRSSTSTTPRSASSPRARWRWASASGAASWACCTWRSSRSGWSASSTWTSSRRRPSVEYRVTLTHGRGVVRVDNPARLPGPIDIEEIAEPWVKAQHHDARRRTSVRSWSSRPVGGAAFLTLEYLDPAARAADASSCRSRRSSSTSTTSSRAAPRATPRMDYEEIGYRAGRAGQARRARQR